MLRVRFTAEDFARIRFAPRPAPLQELHAALTKAVTQRGGPLFAPWRGRVLRSLPAATGPLAVLVPAGRPPSFLDVIGDTMADGFEQIRATSPGLVRSELERVYGTVPAPRWIRDLHTGDETAWHTLRLLAEPHTMTSLARALHVSNPTASSHTAALRSAGMATTSRAGCSVAHQHTAFGTLVAGAWPP
ncbi:hypothetical protein [Streptomyces sp. NPDC056544]|uniref:hypothetical protein n=1 Tax=unclassified Streptomyces TaxID=2593676 RepID=UPI00369F6AAC